MRIQESAENYLETILIIKKRCGQVRAIDIVNELSFSKPSVSVAMKNLRINGYIDVDANGNIELLEQGRLIAEKIYERHTLLTRWLTALGVNPQTGGRGCLSNRACHQRGNLRGSQGVCSQTVAMNFLTGAERPSFAEKSGCERDDS